jgi:hypothetical protein
MWNVVRCHKPSRYLNESKKNGIRRILLIPNGSLLVWHDLFHLLHVVYDTQSLVQLSLTKSFRQTMISGRRIPELRPVLIEKFFIQNLDLHPTRH